MGYTSGSELSENGKYFVFINQGHPEKAGVKSVTPPQLDTGNWTVLKYITQGYQRLVRIAYVNGNTENVSVLKEVLLPNLSLGTGVYPASVTGSLVSGAGIPANTSILSINHSSLILKN